MTVRALVTAIAATLFTCAAAQAQGGPPFRTDDPETPGNRHWEINAGWIADHNPGASAYQVPDFDFNYGWGDRIQLKYELPIALATDSNNVTRGGLGESLLGVKWRFYEHRPNSAQQPPKHDAGEGGAAESSTADSSTAEEEVPEANFSLSTYPQLSLDNPTSAVQRGVVAPGPDFLLPLETNARVGPVRLDAETGYWFGNGHTPQQWIRGLIAGHEFTKRTELYAEIYDIQDANRIDGEPKKREATLGGGGRHALSQDGSILLLFMGGRSFQSIGRSDGQPSWIAYLGVQFLLGRHEDNPQVEKKVPDEDPKK